MKHQKSSWLDGRLMLIIHTVRVMVNSLSQVTRTSACGTRRLSPQNTWLQDLTGRFRTLGELTGDITDLPTSKMLTQMTTAMVTVLCSSGQCTMSRSMASDLCDSSHFTLQQLLSFVKTLLYFTNIYLNSFSRFALSLLLQLHPNYSL